MIARVKDGQWKGVANGAERYWHGTLAAFNNVKDKIPNNTVICITDDSQGGVPADISAEPENIIKQRPDGLFATIYINREADNALEQKNGLYVKDLEPRVEELEKPYPFTSIEFLAPYLYKATFDYIPEYEPLDDIIIGGCTSFFKAGKVYRNFDYNYDNTATVFLTTPYFRGIGYVGGIENGKVHEWDKDRVAQLPNRVVDGLNTDGIFISTHMLFNDFGFAGQVGANTINLVNIPTQILMNCNNMAAVENWVNNNKTNFSVPQQLIDAQYLLMFFITDGTTIRVLQPTNMGYELRDITAVPKLTNFAHTGADTVNRTDGNIQNRPTGIERFNMALTSTPEQLKFTECYKTTSRLSEFIGMNGTTKASTDAQLQALQATAAQAYNTRTRDGATWQTVHSIVYDLKNKSIDIKVQEDFANEIHLYGVQKSGGGGGGGEAPIGSVISYFGINTPDDTWLFCDGAQFDTLEFPDLYDILGTDTVPDLTNKTLMGGGVLGTASNGALPNIKGAAGRWRENTQYNTAGALYRDSTTRASGGSGGSSETVSSIAIDASRSSNLYKDGQAYVEPANVRCNFIIKAK